MQYCTSRTPSCPKVPGVGVANIMGLHCTSGTPSYPKVPGVGVDDVVGVQKVHLELPVALKYLVYRDTLRARSRSSFKGIDLSF